MFKTLYYSTLIGVRARELSFKANAFLTHDPHTQICIPINYGRKKVYIIGPKYHTHKMSKFN